jgi:hypothetical protein
LTNTGVGIALMRAAKKAFCSSTLWLACQLRVRSAMGLPVILISQRRCCLGAHCHRFMHTAMSVMHKAFLLDKIHN